MNHSLKYWYKWFLTTIIPLLLLISCVSEKKTDPTIFTNKIITKWENSTTDMISDIYERNKKTKTDTFELKLLGNYYHKLYHHFARLYIIKTIKADTTFLNAKINECIIIERTYESRMYFDIIYTIGNKSMSLSFNNIPHKRAFALKEKVIIDSRKLQQFIQAVRVSDLFKNKNNTCEYYPGDVIISFFSKDKVEIFPFLTFNFSNNIYRRYNDLLQKKYNI